MRPVARLHGTQGRPKPPQVSGRFSRFGMMISEFCRRWLHVHSQPEDHVLLRGRRDNVVAYGKPLALEFADHVCPHTNALPKSIEFSVRTGGLGFEASEVATRLS